MKTLSRFAIARNEKATPKTLRPPSGPKSFAKILKSTFKREMGLQFFNSLIILSFLAEIKSLTAAYPLRMAPDQLALYH